MRLKDSTDLLVLSALWGASFLFMRIGTPEFGPVVLAALRVGIGSIVLLPILMLHADFRELKDNWGKLAWTGILNTAIPFMLFPFSTLYPKLLAAGDHRFVSGQIMMSATSFISISTKRTGRNRLNASTESRLDSLTPSGMNTIVVTTAIKL